MDNTWQLEYYYEAFIHKDIKVLKRGGPHWSWSYGAFIIRCD